MSMLQPDTVYLSIYEVRTHMRRCWHYDVVVCYNYIHTLSVSPKLEKRKGFHNVHSNLRPVFPEAIYLCIYNTINTMYIQQYMKSSRNTRSLL